MHWPPTEIRFLGSFPRELPPSRLPEVAFAGRSNVGKSSAINAVLGRRGIARTSRTPGRTQAVNLFELDERSVVADLPGYGYAKVPEAMRHTLKAIIERYLSERETLRLVVLLVDGRRDAQDLDVALAQSMLEAEIPFHVVATKWDRIRKSRRHPTRSKLAVGLGVGAVLPFSAHEGDGVDKLRRIIAKAMG